MKRSENFLLLVPGAGALIAALLLLPLPERPSENPYGPCLRVRPGGRTEACFYFRVVQESDDHYRTSVCIPCSKAVSAPAKRICESEDLATFKNLTFKNFDNNRTFHVCRGCQTGGLTYTGVSPSIHCCDK